MDAIPVIWTPEALRRAAKFDVVKEFRRSHAAIRAAHKAEKATGEPDHDIRLKAASLNLKLADAFPERDDPSQQSGRPVAVNIILSAPTNGHAGPALSTHGVRLHLSGDFGEAGQS